MKAIHSSKYKIALGCVPLMNIDREKTGMFFT